MKYRRKPQVVDAVQWTGEPFDYSVAEWLYNAVMEGTIWRPIGEDHITIDTLEGNMICQKGDYIIRGIKEELYPCKPDVFEATYEVAE
jgi:hypothetical protein